MFLVYDDVSVRDFDLDLAAEVAAIVDRHLDEIERGDPAWADAIRDFDWGEYVAGLGFAACQAYLASTFGQLKIPKDAALALDPRHRTGKSVVKLVNHAANRWKHESEWAIENNGKHRVRTLAAFVDAGIGKDENYPLLAMLRALVGPDAPRFATLLSALVERRDEPRRRPSR